MNALDRAIGWFSPSTALGRVKARTALRAYEGATVGRRASSFRALSTSANAEIQGALRPLRDRSREMGRNTPYGARMLDVFAASAVGSGIVPVWDTGSDPLDERLTNLWGEWEEQSDVEGVMGFYAQQVLATRSTVEAGEVVARFIDRPFDDPTKVPLQLQLLEADYIDQWRDGIYGDGDVDGLERTRLGVGLGEFDRRLGLWLNQFHPGEINTTATRPGSSVFVGADELMHVYRVLRPGQARGVPWFAPVLMTARDLADFTDAVNVKARVEACFAGFITNDDSTAPLLDPAQPNAAGRDRANPDAQITSLEPGMLKELRSGQDIKFAQPTSAGQVEPILLFNMQAIAAGAGFTYDQVSGDLRQANFSSLRAGKTDFYALVSQFQDLVLIPRFCRPTAKRFCSRAVLAGLLPRGERFNHEWIPPAREPIDPKGDVEADKAEVRSGRMSPQQFVAKRGNDWRRVQDQTAKFLARADAKGLVFDIDPRKTDQSGNQTPPDAAPTDDTGEPVAAPGATDDTGEPVKPGTPLNA